jgi:hypothetical protein
MDWRDIEIKRESGRSYTYLKDQDIIDAMLKSGEADYASCIGGVATKSLEDRLSEVIKEVFIDRLGLKSSD